MHTNINHGNGWAGGGHVKPLDTLRMLCSIHKYGIQPWNEWGGAVYCKRNVMDSRGGRSQRRTKLRIRVGCRVAALRAAISGAAQGCGICITRALLPNTGH